MLILHTQSLNFYEEILFFVIIYLCYNLVPIDSKEADYFEYFAQEEEKNKKLAEKIRKEAEYRKEDVWWDFLEYPENATKEEEKAWKDDDRRMHLDYIDSLREYYHPEGWIYFHIFCNIFFVLTWIPVHCHLVVQEDLSTIFLF